MSAFPRTLVKLADWAAACQVLGLDGNNTGLVKAVGVDVGNTFVKIYPLPSGGASDTPLRDRLRQMQSVPVISTDNRSPEGLIDLVLGEWGHLPTIWHVVSVDPEFTQPFEQVATHQGLTVTVWDAVHPIPISNPYDLPGTLGVDRLLVALAARALYPGQATIVVDAGTAVTVDLIGPSGDFEGGAIAPGLPALNTMLSSSGRQLPEIDLLQAVDYPGTSTESCLAAGLHAAFDGGVARLVALAEEQAPDAAIVVTGGDLDRVVRALSGSTHHVEPALFHMGFLELERIRAAQS